MRKGVIRMSEKLLGRDALLKVAEVPTAELDVPELGGKVRFKGFTAKDQLMFEKSFQGTRGTQDRTKVEQLRERLIIATLVDESGNKMLTENDISVLQDQPQSLIDTLYDCAARLTGYKSSDQDLVKN